MRVGSGMLPSPPEKLFREGLPNRFADVHNARPAEVLATGREAPPKRFRSVLTESKRALRYLAHLGGNAGVNEARKKISQGVDGREIGCKMVSSLGHFGAAG